MKSIRYINVENNSDSPVCFLYVKLNANNYFGMFIEDLNVAFPIAEN